MQRLTQRWYGDSAQPLLLPLASLFGCISAVRRRLYAAGILTVQRLAKPVVVVGNLTVGGTGKTPLVVWLARELTATGLKVGIVSRGYGRAAARVQVVHADTSWREVGDEPLLLRELTGCDTVVARDRAAGARELVARGADLVVADDGLQHLRLGRDCEIVVIDGARGFGNGQLLPAGPLREPVSRLRYVDLLVLNGIAAHGSVTGEGAVLVAGALQMTLSGDAAWRVDGLAEPVPLAQFSGQRVHAVAGIGNPGRFFSDLRRRGLDVIEHAFADHHPFVAAELTFADGIPVLMTHKDAVKCREFANPQLWYVPVAATFGDAQALQLLERVRRLAKRNGG